MALGVQYYCSKTTIMCSISGLLTIVLYIVMPPPSPRPIRTVDRLQDTRDGTALRHETLGREKT